MIGDSVIESIYSFDRGRGIVYQLKGTDVVYYLNSVSGEETASTYEI